METPLQERPRRNLSLGEMVVRLPQRHTMTDDELLAFSSLNPDLRIELTSEGDLIIMPPAGGETGGRNAEILIQLGTWAKEDGTGKVFDSSTGFRLPSGAVRSPDASWLSKARWEELGEEQRKKYPLLCPEFVIELLSPTDSLKVAQEKMREYLENGAKLGWLIDPEARRLYRYTVEGIELLDAPDTVSAAPVLGFALDSRELWPG